MQTNSYMYMQYTYYSIHEYDLEKKIAQIVSNPGGWNELLVLFYHYSKNHIYICKFSLAKGKFRWNNNNPDIEICIEI